MCLEKSEKLYYAHYAQQNWESRDLQKRVELSVHLFLLEDYIKRSSVELPLLEKNMKSKCFDPTLHQILEVYEKLIYGVKKDVL